jgi:hypothetical protein
VCDGFNDFIQRWARRFGVVPSNTSTDRVGRAPVSYRSFPRPPADDRIFHSSGPRGRAFTIRLVFTGVARPSQYYRVYETMPVRVLYCRIAIHVLWTDPRGIRIYVEDRLLFHRGTISDQFDRGTSTPFLVPNSVAEIRLVQIGGFGPVLAPLPAVLLGADIVPVGVGPDFDGESFDSVVDMPSPPSPLGSEHNTSDDDVAMAVILSDECKLDSEDPDTMLQEDLSALDVPAARRVSTRARANKPDQDRKPEPVGQVTTRRLVRDRWYYLPEGPKPLDPDALESSSSSVDPGDESLTPAQINQLVRRFNIEGKNHRAILKGRIQRAWRARTHPHETVMEPQNVTSRDYQQELVCDESSSDGTPSSVVSGVAMTPYEAVYGTSPAPSGSDRFADVDHALDAFLAQLLGSAGILNLGVVFDAFLDQQLRQFELVLAENKRLFLDEIYSRANGEKAPIAVVSDELRQERTAALWAGLRRVYFAELEPEEGSLECPESSDPESARRRRRLPTRGPRVPDDLHHPGPGPPDDPGDAPTGSSLLLGVVSSSDFEEDCEYPSGSGYSNGEDVDGNGDSNSGEQESVGIRSLSEGGSSSSPKLKELFLLGERIEQFDTASAFVNHNVESRTNTTDEVTGQSKRPIKKSIAAFIGEARLKIGDFIGNGPIEGQGDEKKSWASRLTLLSTKTMRRILAAKETIHKYGVFVPRNDREADSSPEAVRWASGRQLEWIRLQEQGTFERNWDWIRLRKAYPSYQKRDVGHVFFVYDHKHSGEHRVRLVFDGSKQNP